MPVFSDEPLEGDSFEEIERKQRAAAARRREEIRQWEEEMGCSYEEELKDYERTMESLRKHGQ